MHNRARKIHTQCGLRRQLLVFGELFAVVQGQRPTQARRQRAKQSVIALRTVAACRSETLPFRRYPDFRSTKVTAPP